ncbi:MAG: cyclase family protein [Planctomycetota bacterium]
MAIHDISVPVMPGLVGWPGDPPVVIERHGGLDHPDACVTSTLQLGSHCGTHLDAPAHFLPGTTVDRLPLEALLGPAQVLDCRGRGMIDADDLASAAIETGITRLLLRSDNSERWSDPCHRFAEDFVALTPAAAASLIAAGIRLIGIDYLSIGRMHDGAPTHRLLLGAGIVILEGLDLRQVDPGVYDLACLPLKLAGGDGAPCRAVLRDL